VGAGVVAVVVAVVVAGVVAGVVAVAIVRHLAVAIVHHLAVAIVRHLAVAIVHHLLLAGVVAVGLWGNLLENLQPKHHLLAEEGIVHQLHPMAIGRRTDTKLNFRMEFCKEGWQTAQGQ